MFCRKWCVAPQVSIQILVTRSEKMTVPLLIANVLEKLFIRNEGNCSAFCHEVPSCVIRIRLRPTPIDVFLACVQVKLLVERAYRRAKDLVQSNISVLHDVAAVLMEKENIDGDEFQKIIMSSAAKQYLKDDAPGVTIPYQA